MLLGKSKVGAGCPTYIIAEIGQSHEGSLGNAMSYINLAKECGANAVKFQTHFANEESTKHDQFRVNIFPQDNSRYDYWKRVEFSENEWSLLNNHANDLGIDFISTPFSIKAFNLLNSLKIPFWKIGSGEINNQPLMEAILNSNRPIIASTGMSNWLEIDSLVKQLNSCNSEFAILQCTSSYPTPPELVGLNVIGEIKEKYNCITGLSDHSGKIYPSIAAISYGASILEVHLTFSKKAFGPDISSSLDPDEFQMVVEARDYIYQMNSNPVDKDKSSESLEATKKLFSRSLVLNRDVKKGEILTRDDIAFKKPGGGKTFDEIENFINQPAKRDYSKDDLL